MKNADAKIAILVDIRMPHLREKLHRRRRVRIVVGESQTRFEVATFVHSAWRAEDRNTPVEDVVVLRVCTAYLPLLHRKHSRLRSR